MRKTEERMGRQIRIPALTDCQIKKGCYQPAHEETIKWRNGWRNGFVKKWNELSNKCADEFFRCADKDGWEKGEKAGKRDRRHECPAYPHPKGTGNHPSTFRVAWRLGWYKAYNNGETKKRGCGSTIGRRDAEKVHSAQNSTCPANIP